MPPSSLRKYALAGEFNDRRRVSQGAGVVDHRAVDQGHSAPSRLPAIAAVDVPEDMEPRLDPEYSPKQVLTSSVFGQDVRFVERAVGRFVGDKHVRIVRNEIPMLADFHQPIPCKRPIPAHRVDRRSPELHPFQGDPGILQVNGFGQVGAGQLRFALEEQIVIAGDDQLVPEGKYAQPGIEVIHLFDRPPVKVARMNQDVAGRKFQLAVKPVSVANANQAQRPGPRTRFFSFSGLLQFHPGTVILSLLGGKVPPMDHIVGIDLREADLLFDLPTIGATVHEQIEIASLSESVSGLTLGCVSPG